MKFQIKWEMANVIKLLIATLDITTRREAQTLLVVLVKKVTE
jgi:hypothetical protein